MYRPTTPAPSTLALEAGVLLLLLLPCGLFAGVTSPLYLGIFLLHLLILLWATCGATRDFWRLIPASGLSPLLIKSAVILFIGLLCLRASLPITARDALIHHLAVPKWWIERGYIYPIPWHEWSLYPMLIQLAYGALLTCGLERLTPYYHMLYVLLLCGITGSWVARRTNQPAGGVVSALLLLCVPICLNLASTPLVDLGLALYSAMAIMALVEALRTHKTRELWAGGLAMGLALGCKPNALLACALLIPCFFLAAAGQPLMSRIRSLVIFCFAALSAYLPWMLKSWIWVGNPFYPFFKSWLGPSADILTGVPLGFTPVLQRFSLYQESWLEVLALPIRMFLVGQDDNPALFDGRLSPLLLIGLLALWKLRKEPWVQLMGTLSVLYLLFAIFLTGARIRYLAPVYAPLAILAALGLQQGTLLIAPRRPTLALNTLLGLQIVLSLWYEVGLLQRAHPEVWWQSGREAYLSAQLEDYEMISYINSTLPPQSRTCLLLTGNRFYYFERPVWSSGYASANALIHWLTQCRTVSCLLDELHARGVTHVMAHTERLRNSLEETLSDSQKEIWNEFHNSWLTPIAARNGFVLWELRSERGQQ